MSFERFVSYFMGMWKLYYGSHAQGVGNVQYVEGKGFEYEYRFPETKLESKPTFFIGDMGNTNYGIKCILPCQLKIDPEYAAALTAHKNASMKKYHITCTCQPDSNRIELTACPKVVSSHSLCDILSHLYQLSFFICYAAEALDRKATQPA